MKKLLVCLLLLLLVTQINASPFDTLLQKIIFRAQLVKKNFNDGKKVLFQPTWKLPAVTKVNEVAVISKFKKLEGIDDDLLRQFQKLALAERAIMVELAIMGQKIMRKYPKTADDLLIKLDKEGLHMASMYGDDVIDAVATLGPGYKNVLRKMGNGANIFYKKYIKPHPKKIIGTAFVATYIANPEQFHDAAGNILESGIVALSDLSITVGSSVSRGAVKGFYQNFVRDPVSSSIGIILILIFILLSFFGIRKSLFSKIKALKNG